MSFIIKEKRAYLVNGHSVNLGFEIKEGALNILTGPNGSGKTTLFTHLKINRGFFGAKKAAFMDQGVFRPLADMKVIDALKVVFEEVPGARHWSELPAIEKLNLEVLLKKNVSYLSGGENQRLKLAMALMVPFDVLLADEPLQNLDANYQRVFLEVFAMLLEDGKTLLVIEHDKHKLAGLQVNEISGNEISGNEISIVEREGELEVIGD